MHESTTSRSHPRGILWLSATLAALAPAAVEGSFLEGETLDTVANVLSWVVLTVGPAVAIVVFLSSRASGTTTSPIGRHDANRIKAHQERTRGR